jgi:hypothetical protein
VFSMDTLPAFYEPIDGMHIAAWKESPEGIEIIAFSSRKSAVCPQCVCGKLKMSCSASILCRILDKEKGIEKATCEHPQ